MSTLIEQLQAGIAAHQTGDLDTAANAYQAVLAEDPEQADGLHFMGLLTFQRGDADAGIAMIRRSLEIAPVNSSAHNNLGNLLKAGGKIQESADAYQHAIQTDPGNADAWNNLGVLLRGQEMLEEAANALTQATKLVPGHAEAWHNLGLTFLFAGALEEAAKAFETCLDLGVERWSDPVWHARVLCALGRQERAISHLEQHLVRSPGDAVASHQLAAIRGEQVERAPDDYVREHFDSFSETFDEVLTKLGYRAPEIVAEVVSRLQKDQPPLPDVIDLGCGTGLCGPLIRDHCGKLTGIDLSPGMLRKAHTLGCYDFLVEGELVACLLDAPRDCFDLAVCVDTLCYFGPLDAMFAALLPALKPGASLVATVERLEADRTEPYRIDQSGRYTHREAYLSSAITGAGLVATSIEPVILRRELGKDVHGFVFVATRPALS